MYRIYKLSTCAVLLIVSLSPLIIEGHGAVPWDPNLLCCSSSSSVLGPAMVYDVATANIWMIYRGNDLNIYIKISSDAGGTYWEPDINTNVLAKGGMVDAVYALGKIYVLYTNDVFSCDPITGTNCSGTVYANVMSCSDSTDTCGASSTLISQSWYNPIAPLPPTLCTCAITYDNTRGRFVFILNNPSTNDMEIWTGTIGNNGWTFGQLGGVTDPTSQGLLPNYGATLRYLPTTLGSMRYYVVWTGADEHINILQSDDAVSWTNKVTLSETTDSFPTIGYNGAEQLFHISWSGTDSDSLLNDITSSDAITWSNKVTLTQFFSLYPSLVYVSGSSRLFLGWTDRNNFLEVIRQVISGGGGGCAPSPFRARSQQSTALAFVC